MKPINDFNTKFYENDSHVGHTKLLRAKFVVLPHVAVARSCPILKHGAAEPPKEEKVERRKYASRDASRDTPRAESGARPTPHSFSRPAPPPPSASRATGTGCGSTC